jgi:hypothetical protein
MKFKLDELAILINDASFYTGEIVKITRYSKSGHYYDVQLPNGDFVFVKESELNELSNEQKELIKYIYNGNRVALNHTDEKVSILKVDYLNNQAGIEFDDNSSIVVGFEALTNIDKESESVGEIQKNTHEDLVNIFFNHYKNIEGTYTVPKELLLNLLNHIYEA